MTTQLLQAVDSEHNKNIYEDSRREFQLLRSTTCEGQPLRQYGSGNMFTLSHAAHASEVARVNRPRHFESHLDLPGEVPVAAPEGAAHEGDDNSQPGRGSVAEQLRRFWEDNYSSHIMKLAIVAPLATQGAPSSCELPPTAIASPASCPRAVFARARASSPPSPITGLRRAAPPSSGPAPRAGAPSSAACARTGGGRESVEEEPPLSDNSELAQPQPRLTGILCDSEIDLALS